jgi:hypothetical protein
MTVSVPVQPSFSIVLWAKSATAKWNNYAWLAGSRVADGFLIDPVLGDASNRVQYYIADSNASLKYVGTVNATTITAWHQYGMTYDANNHQAYLIFDGQYSGPYTVNMTRSSGIIKVSFGYDAGSSSFGKGSESNVQIYNASLSGSNVTELYQGGMGGAPVLLHNLVGWWPLNGNANDYSGNGNNATLVGSAKFKAA